MALLVHGQHTANTAQLWHPRDTLCWRSSIAMGQVLPCSYPLKRDRRSPECSLTSDTASYCVSFYSVPLAELTECPGGRTERTVRLPDSGHFSWKFDKESFTRRINPFDNYFRRPAMKKRSSVIFQVRGGMIGYPHSGIALTWMI